MVRTKLRLIPTRSTAKSKSSDSGEATRHREQASETENRNERKVRNDKFDELAKALAQSVTRRTALRRFGVGAAVALLAAFGLAPRAEAGNRGYGVPCTKTSQCKKGLLCSYYGLGLKICR